MKIKDKKAYSAYEKEKKALLQRQKIKEAYNNKTWYTIRAILGHQFWN